MQKIIAYHPEIRVGDNIITGSLNDYYSDEEILDRVRSDLKLSLSDLLHRVKIKPVAIENMGLLYMYSEDLDEAAELG